MNFCVLPSGAWGTAISIHLSRLGHRVTLVPRTTQEALDIATTRENKAFFPGHAIPPEVQIGMEYFPALMEAEVCILACPSKFLRYVCRELKPVLERTPQLRGLITLCKGLEEETNAMASQILESELPGLTIGALSGPTFASQVAEGQPSALVLSTNRDPEFRTQVQEAMSGNAVRIYTTDDLVGVELGGCLKNVYAIASGICDGLGLRDNSKAALLTRALHEMVRVGTALGGRMETFYGLTGFGDLVLTCNGSESRNRTFGELFAKGCSVQDLLEERQMTVEGYRTAKCFHAQCQERGIEAPILEQIYQILFEGQNAQTAIAALMNRTLKEERA